MALKKDVNTDIGLTLSNSYIRIDEQSGTKENINIRTRVYLSQEAREQGYRWVVERIYNFIPSVDDLAPNFIKQGYEYLKTLPEYADAIDC